MLITAIHANANLPRRLVANTAQPRRNKLQVLRISDQEAQVLAHSASRGDRGVDVSKLDGEIEGVSFPMLLDLLDGMVTRGLLKASRDRRGANQYHHTATGLRAERYRVISIDHMISIGLAHALGIRQMQAGEQAWALVAVTQEELDRLIEWRDS